MQTSTLAALALTLLSSSVTAAELSFNNFTAGYEQLDFDCSSDCDGFGVGVSAELSDLFFITGSAARYEDSLNAYSATLGVRTSGTQYAWYGELGLAKATISTPFGRVSSDSELVVAGGIRGLVTPNLELDAGISYVNADDADPSVGVTGTWFFTDTVGVSLGLSGGNDLFGGGLGLRVNF